MRLRHLTAIAALLGMSAIAWSDDAPAGPTSAKLPFTISPETTGITTPLYEDGTPNYIRALNDKYSAGVTPENNAFTAWLEIIGTGPAVLSAKTRSKMLELCGAAPKPDVVWENYQAFEKKTGVSTDTINKNENDDTNTWRRMWEEKDFPEWAAFLKARGDMLDSARTAWEKPRYWMPLVSMNGRTMIGVLLPGLGITRETANMLASRATLRAKAGDFAGFLADITAIQQMARHLGDEPFLIQQLVGVAIENLADRATGAVAGSGMLTAAECDELSRNIDGLGAMPEITNSISVTERWFLLDSIIGIATGRGSTLFQPSDKEGIPLRELDPSSVDWDTVLREANATYDKMKVALQSPTIDGMQAFDAAMQRQFKQVNRSHTTVFMKDDGEDSAAYTKRVSQALQAMFLGSFARAHELRLVMTMNDEMTRTLIAAAKYHAEKGAWPDKLEALSLPKIPVDLYSVGSADPVKYLKDDAGITIYSIGRNHIDDGGVLNGTTRADDIVIGVERKATLPDWATP